MSDFEFEQNIISDVEEIKKILKYQTKLLEEIVTNFDEISKRKGKFDLKKQLGTIQKMMPNSPDLTKIFEEVTKNNKT